MGYGGPRFEFETANEHKAHTKDIEREDVARVGGILRQRDAPAVRAAQRRQLADFRAAEAAERAAAQREIDEFLADVEARRVRELRRAGRPLRPRHTPAERYAMRARSARLVQLAEPKPDPQPAYGGMMYGRCMYQRGREVEYPQGRNGAPYCPGVDRDRIVPDWIFLDAATAQGTALPPWRGSYSVHKTQREATQRAASLQAHYFGVPPYAAARPSHARGRATVIDGLTRRHASALGDLAACADEADGLYNAEDGDVGPADKASRAAQDGFSESGAAMSTVPSIFSHGMSDGPIEAVGVRHLTEHLDKPDVQLHLSRHGSRLAAPRPEAQPAPELVELTLPQLSRWVRRVQVPRLDI